MKEELFSSIQERVLAAGFVRYIQRILSSRSTESLVVKKDAIESAKLNTPEDQSIRSRAGGSDINEGRS